MGPRVCPEALPAISPKFPGHTAHMPVATVIALYWLQSHMYTVQACECTVSDSPNVLYLTHQMSLTLADVVVALDKVRSLTVYD
jgi:hypothetical protein